MPSSLHDANTAASPHPTMSAASTASTTNFRFAHPYTQQPTWACSTSNATVASPHTPTPENAQTDVKDASTTPPVDASTITTMLSGNTQNDATELFRQALKPQDYRASSAFVQHVVQQLLETVDRRRPLSHLRSFVTPEILDNVEHFSAERNHALITLTGQSQTNPGIPRITARTITSPSPPPTSATAQPTGICGSACTGKTITPWIPCCASPRPTGETQ